jgi:hypothetical protein
VLPPSPASSLPSRIVRVAQMHVLFHFAAQRINRRKIAHEALIGLAQSAVPARWALCFSRSMEMFTQAVRGYKAFTE